MAQYGTPTTGFNPNWWQSAKVYDFGGADPAAQQAANEQAAADKLFRPVRRLTEGRANQLMHDPVQAQIKNYLSGVINGQNTPYSEGVLNALQGQQAHGAATAQQAQMEALRQGLAASGGSIYDPGFQAAQRESDAMRQGQNMDYAGQLRAQAALENFNAQSNAARSLGALNQGQNAQINQLDLAGAGYRANRFQEHPTPGVLMPQYDPRMQQPEKTGQGDGQIDNKFAGPQPWANFSGNGTKAPQPQGQASTGQTPNSNPNIAGPPDPDYQVHAYGPLFSNPAVPQPQQPANAIGGFNKFGPNAVGSDPYAILNALMQRNQA